MWAVIGKRILVTIPTLLGLTLALFLMVKAIPGDPAQMLLGDKATPEALSQIRTEMGLDRPIPVQYGLFLKNLLQGDLGRSTLSGRQVSEIIIEKFPATVELAIFAMAFAILIGIPMGFIAALRPGSLLDFLSMSSAVAGVSIPVFWLGLVFIWVFSLQLDWLPVSGRLGIDFIDFEPITNMLIVDALLLKDMDLFIGALKHLILPAVTLGTIPTAFLARMTRSSMLEVLRHDYVRTAFAKGVPNILVYMKHAFKNAFVPIVTVVGLQFGLLLGGAMITETIFSWPGIGSWILDSVNARDIPAIEGGVLTVATAFILVNLCVDLIYRAVDPRVRLQ